MKTDIHRNGKHAPSAIVHSRPISIASNDGVLSFQLTRSPVGVHVKRIHQRSGAGRLDCSAVFHDEASFVEWIDADEMRFTYPLVFQQVGRRFNEFIGQRSHHDAFFA